MKTCQFNNSPYLFLPHSRLAAQSHLSLGRPSHATISPAGHGATTCTSPHSPSPHSHSHAPPAHFCALASVILSHARRGQVWRSARIVCQFTCRVRPGCTHHPSMISNASFRQSSGVGGGCGSSYFFFNLLVRRRPKPEKSYRYLDTGRGARAKHR